MLNFYKYYNNKNYLFHNEKKRNRTFSLSNPFIDTVIILDKSNKQNILFSTDEHSLAAVKNSKKHIIFLLSKNKYEVKKIVFLS